MSKEHKNKRDTKKKPVMSPKEKKRPKQLKTIQRISSKIKLTYKNRNRVSSFNTSKRVITVFLKWPNPFLVKLSYPAESALSNKGCNNSGFSNPLKLY